MLIKSFLYFILHNATGVDRTGHCYRNWLRESELGLGGEEEKAWQLKA